MHSPFSPGEVQELLGKAPRRKATTGLLAPWPAQRRNASLHTSVPSSTHGNVPAASPAPMPASPSPRCP